MLKISKKVNYIIENIRNICYFLFHPFKNLIFLDRSCLETLRTILQKEDLEGEEGETYIGFTEILRRISQKY